MTQGHSGFDSIPMGIVAVARALRLKRAEVLRLIHHGPMVAFRSAGRLMVEPEQVAKFQGIFREPTRFDWA